MKEVQPRGWGGLLRPSYKATSASNLGLSLTLKKANHNVMNCPIVRTKCHPTKRGMLSTAGGGGVGWQRWLNLEAGVSLGAVSPSVKPSDEIAAELMPWLQPLIEIQPDAHVRLCEIPGPWPL